ncbi:unnamed protein product, partial [Urochloa humidicola]
PYIRYSQKLSYTISNSERDIYTKIVRFGRATKSKKNESLIVDYGHVHTKLGDFADSLKPRGELSNETADCILHVLQQKLKEKSRTVVSHRIATFAMSGQLDRKEIKSTFSFNNRLDHCQIIFFPVLQIKESDQLRHWFLITINLKAGRFEVMDSIRGEDDEDLLEVSNKIIFSIKKLWKQHNYKSKVDLTDYELL